MLVDFLREQLGLTGTHVGCDTTQCGACVVHVNGLAMKSCTMLALQCEGAEVTTIEGLAPPFSAGRCAVLTVPVHHSSRWPQRLCNRRRGART